MALFRLNPITRKRLQRFRRIKRGYYSLVILLFLTVASLFSEYIANDRAIVVRYNGQWFFPTWRHIEMREFGQTDAEGWGIDDLEADYKRLQADWRKAAEDHAAAVKASDGKPETLAALDKEYAARHNWLVMPPIPWDPVSSDFWYTEQPGGSPPPNAPDWDRRHFLGTDNGGRDVASRLIYGFRISIFFALSLVLMGQVIGTTLGCLQGYLGGPFDIISQRIIEIWSSLPFLYIVIILGTFFTPSFLMLLFVMALFQWIGITYYMRSEMYREKTREYCLAAKSYGASHLRIVFRHLLPNCLTPLVTFAPFYVVGAIFSLTGLDYLGYGLPAPTPSWGELIDQALQTSNREKLWLSLSPFGAISITLILVTFVGESVREAFDPKQYARYE